jgi:hypothetical protein
LACCVLACCVLALLCACLAKCLRRLLAFHACLSCLPCCVLALLLCALLRAGLAACFPCLLLALRACLAACLPISSCACLAACWPNCVLALLRACLTCLTSSTYILCVSIRVAARCIVLQPHQITSAVKGVRNGRSGGEKICMAREAPRGPVSCLSCLSSFLSFSFPATLHSTSLASLLDPSSLSPPRPYIFLSPRVCAQSSPHSSTKMSSRWRSKSRNSLLKTLTLAVMF